MKFANKLLLALPGTVVAAALAVTVLAENRATRLLEEQVGARLENTARHMLEKIDRYCYERLRDAGSLAADPALVAAGDSPGQVTQQLKTFLSVHREYVSAAFFTLERVRIADTAEAAAGEREAEECWAELAAGSDAAFCAGGPAPGGGQAVTLAVIVKDRRQARGVAILRLPPQAFGNLLQVVSRFRGAAENLRADLVDQKGIVLYSNHARAGTPGAPAPARAIIEERIGGGQAAGTLKHQPDEKAGEQLLVSVRQQGFLDYPGSGWTLNLMLPTRVAFAPVRELRLGVAVALLLTGGILLSILFLLVRSFTRPIEALNRAAREIGSGNLEVRVAPGSRDELGQLAETFNRMAADLKESRRRLSASSGELEARIEARTGELLQANELLQGELSARLAAQREQEERERMLRLGSNIAEELARAEELPAVLQSCAAHIVSVLDAVLVRIWTLESEEILQLKASAGRSTRLDGQHARKRVGEQTIGVIAKEQRPVLTNAVVGDPAFPDQEWVRREGIVAFAGHPLVVEKMTVGVIALFSPRALEPSVLAVLASVAEKIAAFIGRRRAEAALRASEERYHRLFDESIDGIYRTDAQGRFASINRAGARMFGYEEPEGLIGRPALEFWRNPADREAFRAALDLKKAVSAYRIAARKKSGEFVELETSSRMIEGDDGAFHGIEGVLRDVTDRVKSEAERDLLLAQLQEAAANIRTLSGLLPICAGCKKIRDDNGSWSQIETFISAHSDAEFSHGLCPECQKVYFPSVPGRGPAGTG